MRWFRADRWHQKGFWEAYRGSRSLDDLLNEICEPYDNEIQALTEPGAVDDVLERLRAHMNEASTTLSGMLERAKAAGASLGVIADHGAWMGAGCLGGTAPTLLASLYRTPAPIEALRTTILLGLLAAAFVWVIVVHALPETPIRRVALNRAALIVVLIVVFGEMAASSVVPEQFLWIDIVAGGATAGFALACHAVLMRQPVVDDLRREVHHARTEISRIGREHRRLIKKTVRSRVQAYVRLTSLQWTRRNVRRKVSEGYHLGRGLRAPSNAATSAH